MYRIPKQVVIRLPDFNKKITIENIVLYSVDDKTCVIVSKTDNYETVTRYNLNHVLEIKEFYEKTT